MYPRKILCAFFLVLYAGSAFCAVIYVPDDYPTIQDALDAAVSGDTIIVRPGTYVECIDFKGKDVHLTSEKGPGNTTIDGDKRGSVVTFMSGEGPGAILEGFTITNGTGTEVISGYEFQGGGIYCANSSPEIRNNVITGNVVDAGKYGYGGGIRLNDCKGMTVHDNLILSNIAETSGGGLSYGGTVGVTIEGNTVCGNIAQNSSAGGIGTGGGPVLIRNNVVEHNKAGGHGGGICSTHGRVTIDGNLLRYNEAHYGGGIYVSDCDYPSLVMNNMIFENTCDKHGGGIQSYSTLIFVLNNAIVANQAGTRGGGIYGYYYSDVQIRNSIIWYNYAGVEPQIGYKYNAQMKVEFSDVQGGWAGEGNIDETPRFVDATIGDLHLSRYSPCINRGVEDLWVLTDFDGEPRPFMGTCDMGADEHTGEHLLEADTLSLNYVSGGTVGFTLDGRPENGGRVYILLATFAGTVPGIPLPGGQATLPLNWDDFTLMGITMINGPIFQNFLGTLDPAGMAFATFDTLGPLHGAAGLTLGFAYTLDEPFDFASNPINVAIVP